MIKKTLRIGIKVALIRMLPFCCSHESLRGGFLIRVKNAEERFIF